MNTALNQYKQSMIKTATPNQLVIMLYEGGIRFIKLGIEGINSNKYDVASSNLIKAQAIINELVASLNFDFPISKELNKIYEYLLYRLRQANITKNSDHAHEVIIHMEQLLEAWKAANKELLTSGSPKSFSSV